MRESGYHLLFNSALYGIPLYVGARLLTFGLDLLYPPLTALWDVHVPEPFTAEVMLSLALGFLLPFALNRFYDSEKGARRTAQEFGDHIETLIDRSMRDRRLIELSLRSRKAYVGFAAESGIGKNSEADLVLLPLMSGYRDENNLRLHLETNYVAVFDRHLRESAESPIEGFRASDLRVVIPLAEVVSARFFDLDVYQSFQETPREADS